MVEIVKLDSETSISCVRLMEKLARSEAKGKTEELISRVCKKMKLGQSLEKIAEDLVEEISVIKPIYDTAEQSAPEYDPEIILKKLAEKERAERI